MMTEDWLRLAAALRREQVDYVLIGALALGYQGLVRATQDIDLFVRPDPDNVEALKRALRDTYDDPDVGELRAEDLKEYNVVRYGPRDREYVIDLIGRLGEAFSFKDVVAEDLEVEGVLVRVATPQTLYRMKRDTVRPQDRMDAMALRELFDLEDD